MPRILINNPSTGIAQSPHVGVGDIRNLDIDSVPGIAKLNTIVAKKSSTTVDAQVKWIKRDPDTPANIFALDSAGVLYKSADSGATWSEVSDRGGTGQGLEVAWGYVFVMEETAIDIMKISDSSWTNDWAGLTLDTDADWHPSLTSKNDGKIYIGAGRYVASIEQVGTFAPGTSTTYTATAQALDLPASYRIKCIEELGNNLMLGTWQGTSINAIRKADIFPWDRSSVSFGQPISLDEFGVHAMRNTGNSLVVLSGIEGGIYRCDGANAYQIGRLPQDLSGGKYIEYYPGSIVNYKRKVFFGTGIVTGAGFLPGMGVYSIKSTSKGSVIALEHLISTGRDGSVDEVQCTALLPVTQDTLLIGWRDDDDATGFGIDLSDKTSYAYATDYSGYFDSALYETGVNENQWKPTKLEFHLGRPLRTGEGIKFEYRNDLTASFTTIKTLAFADNGVGAISSKTFIPEIPFNIKQGDQIQFRISLLGTSTTSPEFKYAILQ